MTPILGIMASSFRAAAGDYESIATVVVGSGGSSTITFSSIPSDFAHLQVRGIIQNLTNTPQMLVRFNNDSGNNYSRHDIEGYGSTAYANTPQTNANNILHYINGIETSSNAGNAFIIDILDSNNTNKFKTTRSLVGNDRNTSGGIAFISGNWRNTNAVNRIDLIASSFNFGQYSHFALYGIKSA